MKVSLELDDNLARALLALTGADGLEEAVVSIIERFVRRERLERLRALRGKIDMPSNEELEAAELERMERLWGDPLSEDDTVGGEER